MWCLVCAELYQSLLSAVVTHSVRHSDARSFGACMEYAWHALFGEAWQLPPFHTSAEALTAYCQRSFQLEPCLKLFLQINH